MKGYESILYVFTCGWCWRWGRRWRHADHPLLALVEDRFEARVTLQGGAHHEALAGVVGGDEALGAGEALPGEGGRVQVGREAELALGRGSADHEALAGVQRGEEALGAGEALPALRARVQTGRQAELALGRRGRSCKYKIQIQIVNC